MSISASHMSITLSLVFLILAILLAAAGHDVPAKVTGLELQRRRLWPVLPRRIHLQNPVSLCLWAAHWHNIPPDAEITFDRLTIR
jgi:hypothetical protein